MSFSSRVASPPKGSGCPLLLGPTPCCQGTHQEKEESPSNIADNVAMSLLVHTGSDIMLAVSKWHSGIWVKKKNGRKHFSIEFLPEYQSTARTAQRDGIILDVCQKWNFSRWACWGFLPPLFSAYILAWRSNWHVLWLKWSSCQHAPLFLPGLKQLLVPSAVMTTSKQFPAGSWALPPPLPNPAGLLCPAVNCQGTLSF